MNKSDARTILAPLIRPSEHLRTEKPKLIVLDPGHGGALHGATGSQKYPEKKIALDIAERTRRKLGTAGIVIKLTRESDRNISLAARTAQTVACNADLFVSIHANFAENKNASGLETYATTPQGLSSTSLSKPEEDAYRGNEHDAANSVLAYLVHREILIQAPGADRGIKHARFNVLRDAPCPAILVECGFLSNHDDEAKLLNPEYRDKIAEGIAKGVIKYIKLCSE